MHTTTLLTLVALAGIANADVAQHHHRRHHAHAHAPHHRDLVARQRPVMTDAWWETNPNAPSGSAASQESSAVTPTSSVAPINSAAPTSSPPRSSAAPTSAAPTTSSPPAQSAAPTSAQASPSVASSEPSPSVAPPASSAPASASASSPPAQSAESSPSAPLPALSSPSSIDPISRASTPARLSTVTSVRTVNPSASPSGSALPAEQQSSGGGGGLSKTAIIAIAVSASVVGAIAIGWTLFRKWKLRPSNRFDEKMKPIDFSPAGRMDDDFLEKTLHRSASNASADRQRQAFVAELDTPGTHANHVPGVPEHDFTAGYAGAGAGVGAGVGAGAYGAYQADPFAPGAAAGYDGYYQNDAHGYPPQQQGYDEYGRPYEYPTQDGEYAGAAGAGMATHAQGQDGYADLKRGNSNGSDGHQYAHAHAHAHAHAQQQHQQAYPAQHSSPADYDFPESGNYLGRPTGGADGPYAQAATYRY